MPDARFFSCSGWIAFDRRLGNSLICAGGRPPRCARIGARTIGRLDPAVGAARGNLKSDLCETDLQFAGTIALFSTRKFNVAKLNINGRSVDLKVDGDTPLLWALRE